MEGVQPSASARVACPCNRYQYFTQSPGAHCKPALQRASVLSAILRLDLGKRPPRWHQRVFAQPLRDVRNYFGDAVALHFAWCAYYARSLIIPVLCIGLSYGTRRTPGGLRSYRTGGYHGPRDYDGDGAPAGCLFTHNLLPLSRPFRTRPRVSVLWSLSAGIVRDLPCSSACAATLAAFC